jgi:hypothetical protein
MECETMREIIWVQLPDLVNGVVSPTHGCQYPRAWRRTVKSDAQANDALIANESGVR